MLTTEGKLHIKRYLAGYVPVIAQSMSFGIGTSAESLSDIALQLESTKASINLTAYDFALNKLVYKAAVPEEYIGKIYEVGIYSLEVDPAAGEFSSRTLTTFDSATEDWKDSGVDSVFSMTNARIGGDSLSHTPAISGFITSTLSNISIDLSGYSSADTFNFAFNAGNAHTTNIRYRFLTDASNYYDFNTSAQSSGYKVLEFTKGSAAPNGSPDWSNITEIQVTTTSSGGGSASVEHDAIRIEDKDAASLDYILIARKVLASPVTKVPGMSLDVEFTLDVSI